MTSCLQRAASLPTSSRRPATSDNDWCALLLGGLPGQARFCIAEFGTSGQLQKLVDAGRPALLGTTSCSGSCSTVSSTVVHAREGSCSGSRSGRCLKRLHTSAAHVPHAPSSDVTPAPSGEAARCGYAVNMQLHHAFHLDLLRSPCSPVLPGGVWSPRGVSDEESDDADSLVTKRMRCSASPAGLASSTPSLALSAGLLPAAELLELLAGKRTAYRA